ncbi:Hypothetical protein A7982_11746 [Minicystis rosea]|nr:Hypothetical protein A7982_11746 [Minicystis rosea]
MISIRSCAGALAIAAAPLIVGCVAAAEIGDTPNEPETGEAESAFRGMARVPWGGFLNVRFGPGFQYGVAYQLPSFQPVEIACYTVSPFGNVWYRLWDGNFVDGSYVRASPFVPMCGGFGVVHGGGGFGRPRR